MEGFVRLEWSSERLIRDEFGDNKDAKLARVKMKKKEMKMQRFNVQLESR